MSRLSEHLETVAKAVAVVAAGGYIAHRAHLNRLGIPSSTPLSGERYLAEAWFMVSESANLFLRLAFPVLLVAAVVALASRWVLPRLKLTPIFRAWHWLEVESERLWLACATAVTLMLLIDNLWLPPDSDSTAVGTLNAEGLHGPGGLKARGYFAIALAVWAAAAAAVAWLTRRMSAAKWVLRCVWITCRALLVLGLLGLCLHFGMAVRDSRYPKVEIAHEKDKQPVSTSGVLVLETADSLFIWRVAPPTASGQPTPTGETVVVPRDQVVSMTLGPDTDVFTEACLAAGGTLNEEESPLCVPSASPAPKGAR